MRDRRGGSDAYQRRRRWFALVEARREVERPEVMAMLRALAAA
jgi:hypothetical protein